MSKKLNKKKIPLSRIKKIKIFFKEEIWEELKTWPPLIKAACFNKEFMILSVFSIVLGTVIIGIFHLIGVLLNIYFLG